MTSVDEFLAASEPTRKKFDRWGRYLLPHPVTGKMQAWTRATTFRKATSDSFALSEWSQRMTARGMALRPDLVALASTLDVKRDRDRMNELVKQAKDAAGQKTKANEGTARHSFKEILDKGGSLEDIPAAYRPDMAAYVDTLADLGLKPVPHLVERTTVIQEFGVAGTFDNIYQDEEGEYVIGDLKTGNIQYEEREISIQLALYQHGVNQSGVWDEGPQEWNVFHPENIHNQLTVREDYGFVIHLPVGSGTCSAYKADLRRGWDEAKACHDTRQRRKRKGFLTPMATLTTPIPIPSPRPPSEPTWEKKFSSVKTRAEAAALWQDAFDVLGEGPELDRLIGLAHAALA